jgi:hypothetical protein
MRRFPASTRSAPFASGRRLRLAALVLLLAATAVGLDRAPSTSAAQREYGPYDDCYWTWDGTRWSQKRCPQSDDSDYVYLPSGSGWDYVAQCADAGAFQACLFESGLYVETYDDGSRYLEGRTRNYEIYHTDGTLAESGHYDVSGVQVATWWPQRISMAAAMKYRSNLYWRTYGTVTRTIRITNPTWFDSVVAGTSGANAYVNCLWNNNSQTDFDNDGRTGFTELTEHCAS